LVFSEYRGFEAKNLLAVVGAMSRSGAYLMTIRPRPGKQPPKQETPQGEAIQAEGFDEALP
jgi:hypothetical protein